MTASPIPIDALEAAHWLVVGTTGSGKTYLARGLFEQLRRAGRRLGAIDKLGKLWGLTVAADGAGPGLEFVVFGGKRPGAIPMRPGDGARIGDLFVKRNIPAIFDLAQWDADDQEQWVAEFCRAVFAANEAALHLLLDEAQSWVPANGGGPAYKAVKLLAEQGRGNGINLLLTAPRLNGIDVGVRQALGGLVAMRQTSARDRAAVAELVGGHLEVDEKAFGRELPSLPTGEGVVWSPTGAGLERVAFPANATFDSSRTPRHGDAPPPPIAVSSALVDELRAALAPRLVVVAEGEQAPQAADIADADRARLMRSVKLELRVTELEMLVAGLENELAEREAECEGYARTCDHVRRVLDAALAGKPVPPIHADGARVETAPPAAGEPPASAAAEPLRGGDGGEAREDPPLSSRASSPTEHRALGVLAAVAPAGLTEADWAARAGYARKGGAWQRRRRRDEADGRIEKRGDRWHATALGRAEAGDASPAMPAPGRALAEWWAARLGGAAARILRLLAAIQPRALTRDAIAAELGMAARGGAFNRGLQALKAAELVVDAGKRISAAPALMGAPA